MWGVLVDVHVDSHVDSHVISHVYILLDIQGGVAWKPSWINQLDDSIGWSLIEFFGQLIDFSVLNHISRLISRMNRLIDAITQLIHAITRPIRGGGPGQAPSHYLAEKCNK